MASVKIYRLKASTLLEVIVAMVVVLVVFVAAVGIYTNVMRSSPSIRQQYIRKISENLIQQAIRMGDWKDEVQQTDSVLLKKEVRVLEGYADLMVIEVVASAYGKEVSRIRKIVKRESNVENKEVGNGK